MTEQTTQGNSIGQLRLDYLSKANTFLSSGQIDYCLGCIESFRRTLIGNSIAANTLIARRKEIEQERKESIDELDERCKKMGFLEGKDIHNENITKILIKEIDDLLEACWSVSQEESLFHDIG